MFPALTEPIIIDESKLVEPTPEEKAEWERRLNAFRTPVTRLDLDFFIPNRGYSPHAFDRLRF